MHLLLPHNSLSLSSVLLIPFSLSCFSTVFFHHFLSSSLTYSSVSVILLVIPSSVFLFLLLCCSSLFFSSSRSILSLSCIFLIHACILFLKFQITFTTISLNSFPVRLSFSSLFILCHRFLPCCFIHSLFFSHLNFSCV